MPSSFVDGVSEQRINDFIANKDKQQTLYKANATPKLAEAAATIYRNSPWLTPGQVLALAKSNASPQATALASDLQSRIVPAALDPQKPKNQSWFERNVYNNIKETARWGFAALQFVPDVTQNLASQIFSENDPAGFDGWFKSTALGTMTGASQGDTTLVTNPDGTQSRVAVDAGTGWFMSGTAAEKQSERARQVRGTINGSAWTVGRGAASAVFAPGSMQYNLLSGFLDAAVNVLADPTLYAGQALKAARAGEEVTKGLIGTKAISNVLAKGLTESGLVKSAAIQGLKTADELAAVRKIADAGTRALAGLSTSEAAAFDNSAFMKFFQTDRRAVRLVESLADPANNNGYKILKDVFDFKIDAETAQRLANSTSKDQIYALLGEQSSILKDVSSRMLPGDIRDIRGAKWGTVVKERIPFYNNFRDSRLLTEVPDTLVIHGSSADRVKAIKDYGNYLNTIKGGFTDTVEGEALMKNIFSAYADNSKAGVDAARDAFDSTVKVLMKEEGASDAVVKNIFDNIQGNLEETKRYFIDEAGNPADGGMAQALIKSGLIDKAQFANLSPQQIDALVLHGPGSVVELLNSAHVLPDVRQVRRITGNPFLKKVLTNPETADARSLIAATEYIQNNIWKPVTLATGGYIMRNMFDAQVRIATIGKEGFFNHPLRYIQWAMKEKGAERIVGKAFDDLIDKTAANWDDVTDYYHAAMQMSLGQSLEDIVPSQVRAVRNGSYKVVNKMAEPDLWLKGMVEEYVQIAKDTIENGYAKGLDTDQLLNYLKTNEKGKAAVKQIEEYLKGGISLANSSGYSQKVIVSQVDDNVLRDWIEKLAKGRVDLKTAGDSELKFAIGHGRVPLPQTSVEAISSIKPSQIIDGPGAIGVGGKAGKGSLIDLGFDAAGKPEYGIVINESGGNWQIQRVSANRFVGKTTDAEELVRGRAELAKFISDKQAVVDLPQHAKLAETTVIKDAKNPLDKMLKQGTDWFFHKVYENRVVNPMERSPLYRQFYYEKVSKNVDALTPDEAKKLITNIEAQAAKIDMKPKDYVGTTENWKKIQSMASKANGTATIEQLDDYAGLIALDSVKEALFNASNKNNLQDILRIVMPFGAAWSEVIGTYAKFAIEDPTRIRRAQLMFKGATDFDPDGNGRGFFYKDPTTNEYTFNFPLSGELSKLATGIDAPLQGTVKRVSIGLDWHPALGPVGQIAASKLIPDTPTFDGITSILLPYGRGTGATLEPSWVKKLRSGLFDDPSKLDGIYANTYIDTMRALSASGNYDLNTPEGQRQLMEDAKGKARILTSMRALGQFFGPTSPSVEFNIPTKDGDILASQLVKEFYQLQQNNYDTAVGEFMRIYGEDALLYLSSKSKATITGLEATREFGNWERTNKGVIRDYPDIYAFFAPGGSEYDINVWQRQITSGKRERLNDKQVIEQAQYRVAATQYKSYRSQVGAYPNEDQRAWLKNVRVALHDKYPGFPVVPEFTVGVFEKKVEQMKQAVTDPRLKDNDVAKAVSTYFGYRDQVLAQWVASGGSAQGLATSKGAEPLRGYLTSIGDALALQVPDFGRVWERELLSEVDQ